LINPAKNGREFSAQKNVVFGQNQKKCAELVIKNIFMTGSLVLTKTANDF